MKLFNNTFDQSNTVDAINSNICAEEERFIHLAARKNRRVGFILNIATVLMSVLKLLMIRVEVPNGEGHSGALVTFLSTRPA